MVSAYHWFGCYLGEYSRSYTWQVAEPQVCTHLQPLRLALPSRTPSPANGLRAWSRVSLVPLPARKATLSHQTSPLASWDRQL